MALLVLHSVFVQETERGTKAPSVDELDNGKQLLQFVFQWSAGEHESIAAF